MPSTEPPEAQTQTQTQTQSNRLIHDDIEHEPKPPAGQWQAASSEFQPQGTRTPRRIKWLDERRRSNSAAHVLDPAGQDPEAFNTLVDALEKHRRETPKPLASTPLTSKVHYYSHRSPGHGLHNNWSLSDDDDDDDDEEEEEEEEEEVVDRKGHRGLAEGNGKAKVNLRPGLEAESSTRTTHTRNLRTHLFSSPPQPPPAPVPVTSEPKLATSSHKTHDSKWYSTRRAKRLVEYHTNRVWPARFRRRAKGRGGSSRTQHEVEDDGSEFPSPVYHAADVEDIPIPRDHEYAFGSEGGEEEQGGGILSNLLQLYAQAGNYDSRSDLDTFTESRSGYSSGYTSGASTPLGWRSDSEVDLGGESRPETPHRFDDTTRKRPRIPRPRLTIPSLGMVPRHHKARTGGGVFGPLIAATGNLGGVAAPHHSQLQPDVRRPGYKLSRYTAEGDDLRPPPPVGGVYGHGRAKSESAVELQLFSSRSVGAADSVAGLGDDPRHPHHDAQTPSRSLPYSPLSRYSYSPPDVRSDSMREVQSQPHSPHEVPRAVHEPLPKRGALRRLPSLTSLRGFGKGHGANTSGWSTPASFMSTASSFTVDGNWGMGSAAPLLKEKSEKRRERKEKRKRKKAQIYITRHIAQIIQREEFLLKLTRAMMMFGAPSHRLQSQLESAGKVLDVSLSMLYLPDVVLVSFDDAGTGTSHVRLIRQGSALDIGRLSAAFRVYWKVIHDKMSVTHASTQLDELMKRPAMYNWWQTILIGGMCSTAICTVSFGGSFIDAVVCFPLGALLVVIQMLSVRNQLYVHVFEVTVTMLYSFLAAALAATHKFCYSAVASSSVVLILPGFIVLTGSLEIMSRNIVAGSVRLCYAIMYALFLGFGFAMGAELFQIMTSSTVYGTEDYECTATHPVDGPWYLRTPSKFWAFLTVPMFSTFLSLKNQAPWNRKETLVLVGIACVGWVTNYFTGLEFKGQSDIIAAVGAFAVGLIANVYARIFSGNAFVVMVTGILFQLPSGLGTGGLLSYATEQASGSTTSYISGFKTAGKLVSVAIGLAIGLGISLAITYPIQSRRRQAGIFSL